MIATSHVIVGATVGVAVGTVTHNPLAALAAGVVSHLICDAIPHLDSPLDLEIVNKEATWSPGFLAFAIFDSLVAFFVTLALWHARDHFSFRSMLAWGAFGGYLPDLVDNLPLWSRRLHKLPGFRQFHDFHFLIHGWQKYLPMKRHWPLGIATQLVIVLPCLYLLVK